MTIKDSGTVNFWVDPEKNPFAFKDDNKVFWMDFIVDGNDGIITSEGKSLSLILNKGKETEICIFQTDVDFEPNKRRMFTFTWSPNSICFYLDAVLTQEVSPNN